ncbi:MAG: sugar transferase [Planctomycetes bacterium HGW-Planctomycetes-1]|nr:MAG: sugar transferase [Planctomycetes bacterium HGW-Planctomycetes-1]
MYKFIKRLVDILLCLPAIIVLLPVFAVIIIAIKRDSKGQAIFEQPRAGKDGKPFTFYKFRTMRVDVDPFGASPKSGQDPRLTKTGIFLREYSLDELPQLFNVLKGNMSLVGPRPLYMEQIAEWDDEQKKRLFVKPGLTGLAQICGRGELTREEKLAFDVEYIRSASLLLDFKIIFLTLWQVLTRKSIYEKKYSKDEETRGQKWNV